MKNYKIRVPNEAESKEVISLFIQLGYNDAKSKRFGFVYTTGGQIGCDQLMHWDHYSDRLGFQEISLSQLRDLVVLQRNDVNDATHTDIRAEYIYLTTDKVIYYWQGEWCKSAINNLNGYEDYIANSLTPIKQPELEQGLISGADALRAIADGKEVEVHESTYKENDWLNLRATGFSSDEIMNQKIKNKPYTLKFRLKPRTILINGIEVPAPMNRNPEDDEIGFFLDTSLSDGYSPFEYSKTTDNLRYIHFGWWESEEKIKQVVAALRKVFEVQA